MKDSLLQFVAINNDQTDGLVVLLNELKNRLPDSGDQQTLDLTIQHMTRLQRGLAKATDQEISYMELLDTYRS